MKRFLLSVICIGALLLPSCKFDDSDIWDKFGEMEESIRDHEERISALEELCKQMNTNIEALQTLVEALEKRDYVTNVSEVRSNGVVIGYTISFAYSETITIYHGQNGKDGYTPQIGVMQDADGIYYWTLDGEWLLDDNGNKIKANATDGKDGQNGSNGTDGITPLLKIENDYWLVSYDNGATWVQLGKATGEDGVDGTNGKDGDSIFKSVTEDEDNVYFTLADGTVITLPKGDKKTTVDDVCSLMEDITFMKYCYDNFDANKDGMLSQTEAASVYTIDISGLDIYSLAGIEMFTRLESIIAKNCTKLREVIIPNTITSIGDEAFYGCSSLASVTIPESVTSIGKSAFYNCSKLTSVTIPEGVTSIGSDAFSVCSSLTKVNIANLSAWCKIDFSSSTSNPLYYAKNLYLNEELVTTLTIPSDITEVQSYAFYSCKSLTSIAIPESVTSIGIYAFAYCSRLTSITIPNSVTMIGYSAFYGCDGLTSVTIPNSVTMIGESAFFGCKSLTSVTIPDSVTEIGERAFYSCSSLTSVTIPDSVTSIGSYAFRYCTSLTSVYCKPTTPPAGNSFMFDNNASGRKIYVPRYSASAYKSAQYWSNYYDYIVRYDFESGTVIPEDEWYSYLFYEDCGTDVEKDSSYWPYVDQFTGWNPQGDAAIGVAYKGNNASVRASGAYYQPTADAVGISGQPYVYLNKVPSSAHFLIENIAVTGGSNYIFTFNVSCQNAYSNSLPGFAEVTNDLVHLELSYDGTTWANVNFTATPNGGNGWYATIAEFKTKADATKLYARFTYEAPASNGGGRFDDFKLVEGGNGGELDFTAAPTPDPTPDPTPTDAIYAESFTNGQGEFTINDVELGTLTYVWKHESGTYGTRMKASGYSGGAVDAESWLISPAISLVGATKPAVSFDHCHKYAGTPSEELTLWVSENDGADWTQLVISTYGSNSDYSFVTNTTDLTAYVGKTVKIAFKYVSTTANAATWEVSNFKVAEGTGNSGNSGNEGGNDDTGAEATGVFTSDAAFVCSADNSGNKVYTLGESKINGESCSGFKLGTSNNAGFFTSAAVGVSGAKTLGFYGMAWKGKKATLYIKVEGSDEVKSVELKANDSATGNTPFTITVTEADYYSVELTGLTESSKVMFSTDATFSTASSTAARAIVAGVTLSNL